MDPHVVVSTRDGTNKARRKRTEFMKYTGRMSESEDDTVFLEGEEKTVADGGKRHNGLTKSASSE